MSPSAADSPAGDATRCVHGAGQGEALGLGGTIERSSTYRLRDEALAAIAAGRPRDGWIYSRYGNPSVARAAAHLAALERAPECLLTASGQAAVQAALASVARPPARIVAARDLYGGTSALLEHDFAAWGVRVELIDIHDLRALREVLALDPAPAAVFCESISNPLLRVADLPRIVELTRARGVPLIVDATFATPLRQRPLLLGAHLVVHSTSKALAGHSDLIGGAVLGSHAALEAVWPQVARRGATADPQAAYLLERGMKTLALRLAAQEANARVLAAWLAEQPAVRRVHHLEAHDHPDRECAARLLGGPTGMLAFEFAGPQADERALRFANALRIASHAASLGGVETLCSLPALTSHAHATPQEREASGIRPGLVRVSAGIEDAADLLADFAAALAASA